MGAKPYFYLVDYQRDADAALQALRQREFAAGRYYPAQDWLEFPVTDNSPSPGPSHATIEAAREAADASGTASILDVERIAPEPDFCVAAPLSEEELTDLFETTRPTREAVLDEEAVDNLLDGIGRGHCVYFTVWEAEKPVGYFFAGYSFD